MNEWRNTLTWGTFSSALQKRSKEACLLFRWTGKRFWSRDHKKESQGVSSENRYFCFHSCLYVLYAGCLAVKLRPQYPHVPRSLPAQHFVVYKTPVLMTQMFLSRIALPTDIGFYFSYTHVLGSNFVFFHYQIRRRKKSFHPFWCEIHDQGQTPDAWRPPIHARVRKIQSALASFGRLTVQTTLVHCPSLNYQMNRESSNWFLANPSPVLFPVELLFASMGPVECSRARPTPMFGAARELTTPPTQNPSTPSGPLNRSCP